jgi:hypothetical protein
MSPNTYWNTVQGGVVTDWAQLRLATTYAQRLRPKGGEFDCITPFTKSFYSAFYGVGTQISSLNIQQGLVNDPYQSMDWFNNTVIANNAATEILLNSDDVSGGGSLHWASRIYIKIKEICPNLVVFPAAFFNPEWQIGADIDFLKKDCPPELYDGSFSWHWHNKWENVIEEGSKFDILDKILEEKYMKKFNIG